MQQLGTGAGASNRWQTSESEPALTHIMASISAFSFILSIVDYIQLFGKPSKQYLLFSATLAGWWMGYLLPIFNAVTWVYENACIAVNRTYQFRIMKVIKCNLFPLQGSIRLSKHQYFSIFKRTFVKATRLMKMSVGPVTACIETSQPVSSRTDTL